MNWTDVRGWLTEAEGQKLQELAAGKTVLELGSYCGRSTCAMARTAARIVAVDWGFGDEGAGFGPTTLQFLSTLLSSGLDPSRVVIPMIGRIEDVVPFLRPASFDLVFIDSAHDAKAVQRDTAFALAMLRRPGVIAWHDSKYPSVQEGLKRAGCAIDHSIDSLGWEVMS